MDEKMKYTKICELITNAIGKHIPKRYIDVMFDSVNYVYHVKITNKFGVAEYKFMWSTVLDYGINYIVDVIQRDFIFSKELEEV